MKFTKTTFFLTMMGIILTGHALLVYYDLYIYEQKDFSIKFVGIIWIITMLVALGIGYNKFSLIENSSHRRDYLSR